MYAEIGRELEKAGLDSINQRAVVSGKRKLALLARASAAVLITPADPNVHLAALPANLFLVEAAMQHGAATAKSPGKSSQPPRRSFEERAQWTADLFLRLQQADAAKNAALGAQYKAHANAHNHVHNRPELAEASARQS